MTDRSLRFDTITFSYEGASQPLIQGLSAHFPSGWTGIVGANGAGKTTILKLATRLLSPHSGRVLGSGNTLYCDQRTDVMPDFLTDMYDAADRDAVRLRGQLGMQPDWPGRWETLSHGERKRAQIGVALWRAPGLLAIDEPTNHLDGAARSMLAHALAAFRGVGIIVSHDRELLDMLCHQCLFVDPPDAVMRPGNFREGSHQADLDRSSLRRQRTLAREDLDNLLQVAKERAVAARQADRLRSKRGLARHDRDGRAKINSARVSGKDGAAGRRLRQLDGRIAHARERLEGICVQGGSIRGIWMAGSVSRRHTLVAIPAATLTLGAGRTLGIPDLVMKRTDRIALTGPNGAGKSTLIRHITGLVNVEPDRLLSLPQEVDTASSHQILSEVRALPGSQLGQAMIVVSRLGSEPSRVLETDEPSPGEIRKILLAMGIAREPHLIIMDEPTNHLDLPSIECLESALLDCPCGLLLVSHDMRFLGALTSRRWHIAEEPGTPGRFSLREIFAA